MAPKGSSLADTQEVPERSLILLAGASGAGKATFSHQVVLYGVAANRPVIFVTTERSAPDVISPLNEQGLADPTQGLVNLVDAFGSTVGAQSPHRSDTMLANAMDLTSLIIAIAKPGSAAQQERAAPGLDSPTAPYLFNSERFGPPERCAVGMSTASETARTRESCKSSSTVLFATIEEQSSYFTAGFLSGLLSAVKNQHLKEEKCIGLGDPYREREII